MFFKEVALLFLLKYNKKFGRFWLSEVIFITNLLDATVKIIEF